MTFISGRNPDLFIKDENGTTMETIDLSKYTTSEIHQLLIDKGFERNSVGAKDASREMRDIMKKVKINANRNG